MQCKFCKSAAIVKNGNRANSRSPNQRYVCSNCGRQFSRRKGKFSAAVMLRAVGLYNSGLSLAETAKRKTAKRIRKEQKATVSQMTILRWARRLGSGFMRLRDGLSLKYGQDMPSVTSRTFVHSGQAYGFMLHNWKLREFCGQEGLRQYLSGLGPWIDGYFTSGSRCSELRNAEHADIIEKRNFLCDAAARILGACDELRERHPVLEEYLLFNDSSTIAAEVPIFMFDKAVGKIHGHIDLLQVRFGKVWVVDYKPGARSVDRIRVVSQLYWYARGLSYRAKIPLCDIRCCWFDSEACFEFDPMTVRLKTPPSASPPAPENLQK